MAIAVTGDFPAGSIEVVDASDPADIRLRLRADLGTEVRGAYLFRVTGARGAAVRLRILDVRDLEADRLAGRDGYEDAWTNTGPHVSYDRATWFRVAGTMVGRDYVIDHMPLHDVAYYASWAPYPLDRELDLIARVQMSPRVRVETIGASVLGVPIDLLTIGEASPGKRTCWVVARQHPSEAMSGYFLEGMLPRLVDEHDPVARQLLDRAVIYVVPNMNPDGTRLGHTRCNGAGANLNREWANPSPARSPEVVAVQARMASTGVDFFMDCHGDEELRCVFLGGPLEIPSRSPRLASLFAQFERAWMAASPEYELGHGYPGGPPAEADLRMAWNWVAERYGCLGVLLEQPFKDTSWATDPVRGWSPERATRLGASFVAALNQVVPSLR